MVLVLFWLTLPAKLLLLKELLAMGGRAAPEATPRDPVAPACAAGHGSDPGPVTVLVAFRNERRSLPALVKALESQQHPGSFRVVCVDDGSTDGGREWLLTHGQGLSQLTVLASPGRGKTAALAHGLETVTGGILLYTDADCRPGPAWVAGHLRAHADGARLVPGHVRVVGSRMAALESLVASAQVLAGCRAGSPPFVRGGNWSLRVEDLRAVGGYTRLAHLPSGDDIHLLERLAPLHLPCRFLTAADSQVESDAVTQAAQRHQQRRRRYGKLPGLGTAQRWRHLVLGVAFVGLLADLLLATMGLAPWLILAPVLTWLVASWALDRSARVLGENSLRPGLPLLLPLWPLLLLWYGMLGTLAGYRWKTDPVVTPTQPSEP